METHSELRIAAKGRNLQLEDYDQQLEDRQHAKGVPGRPSGHQPASPPAMLTTRAAATRMGIAPSTLRYWRMLHTGPKFVRLTCRNFRYHERDVDAYVEARTYDPSARASLEEHANR